MNKGCNCKRKEKKKKEDKFREKYTHSTEDKVQEATKKTHIENLQFVMRFKSKAFLFG